MLPSNIDLTEKADFGRPSLTFDLNDLDDIDTRNNMTTDEYDSLVRWEGIFGRKRHINQKWNIFPKLNLNVSYGSENPHTLYCAKCGKIIRIPWKNYGWRFPWKKQEICFECNEKGEIDFKGRIPWKYTSTSSRNDEKGYDLFNSK